MLQKKIFLPPGDRNCAAVDHLDVAAFVPDIFLHMLEVDEVGVVGAEKVAVGEELLVFFQVT